MQDDGEKKKMAKIFILVFFKETQIWFDRNDKLREIERNIDENKHQNKTTNKQKTRCIIPKW